jgi:hypothetical protein
MSEEVYILEMRIEFDAADLDPAQASRVREAAVQAAKDAVEEQGAVIGRVGHGLIPPPSRRVRPAQDRRMTGAFFLDVARR